MTDQLWHPTRTILNAIHSSQPGWLDTIMPQGRHMVLDMYDPSVLFIHGSAFGAGHLGVEQWMDPEVGFSIRSGNARDRCTDALSRSPEGVRVYLYMDHALMAITLANVGLMKTLQDPRRIHRVNDDIQLLAVEVFLSTYYGEPLPRLRNLHTFAPPAPTPA